MGKSAKQIFAEARMPDWLNLGKYAKDTLRRWKNQQRYSTDISYLIYKGGQRAYLSATKDLATKEIVAFNVSRDLSMQTAYLGLEKNIET